MNVKNKTEMDKVVGVVSKLIMNVATLTLERQNLGGKNERIQKGSQFDDTKNGIAVTISLFIMHYIILHVPLHIPNL